MTDKVLIWSIEHGMYWKPFSNGYTVGLCEAGLYNRKEANKICKKANLIGENERVIELDEAFESLQLQNKLLINDRKLYTQKS